MERSLSMATKRGVAAVILTACLAAACGGGGGEASSVAAAKRPKAAEPAVDPAVADAMKRTTAAMTVGTSRAPVEVRFGLAAVPQPGQPADVELIVLTQVAVPTVRVEVRSEGDLNVVEPAAPVALDKVQAGTVHSIKVQVVPARAGTSTLTVAVTLEQPTGPEQRTFQLPIVAGVGVRPAPGAPKPAG
jgi:hypothetical protein